MFLASPRSRRSLTHCLLFFLLSRSSCILFCLVLPLCSPLASCSLWLCFSSCLPARLGVAVARLYTFTQVPGSRSTRNIPAWASLVRLREPFRQFCFAYRRAPLSPKALPPLMSIVDTMRPLEGLFAQLCSDCRGRGDELSVRARQVQDA
jgi:hypothetical protein